MNKEPSVKQLIDALVKRLNIQYGSLEIKVHDGKWSNYTVSERVNYTESDSRELLDKIKVKETNKNE